MSIYFLKSLQMFMIRYAASTGEEFIEVIFFLYQVNSYQNSGSNIFRMGRSELFTVRKPGKLEGSGEWQMLRYGSKTSTSYSGNQYKQVSSKRWVWKVIISLWGKHRRGTSTNSQRYKPSLNTEYPFSRLLKANGWKFSNRNWYTRGAFVWIKNPVIWCRSQYELLVSTDEEGMYVGNKGPNYQVGVQVPGARLEHSAQGSKVSGIRQI